MEDINKKIILSDYNYQKDIQNRLIMAEFSLLDVEVLREIVDGSLNTTLQKLTKQLGKKENEVKNSLKTLAKTGLVEIQGDASLLRIPTAEIPREFRTHHRVFARNTR